MKSDVNNKMSMQRFCSKPENPVSTWDKLEGITGQQGKGKQQHGWPWFQHCMRIAQAPKQISIFSPFWDLPVTYDFSLGLTSSAKGYLFLSVNAVISSLGIHCGEVFIFSIHRKITIGFAFWLDQLQGGNLFNQGTVILLILVPRLSLFYASGGVWV